MAHHMSGLRAAAALAVLGAAVPVSAQDPPLFSVANGGPSGLPGDAVFMVQSGVPIQVGGRAGMGLGRIGDEIIGLAPVVIPTIRSTQDFVICFSVDPFAIGRGPLRITQQNLFRQSANHQQAGDAYLSTEAMRRGLGVLPPPFSMGLENNALAVNQSPHYPADFGLVPLADPSQMVPPGTPLDDVDATLRMTQLSPPSLYFTLSGESPSHQFLPGADSGATIFLDLDFATPGSENVYAEPAQLGLDLLDQIDGLIVLDDNMNSHYDGTDTVYVSLGPGSPTLAALGLAPGDMLVIDNGLPALFVDGVVFGLLPGDNMDSLDMVPLVNGSAEDTINAMVDCPADYNDDDILNALDFLAFFNGWNAGDPRADFTGDGTFDAQDFLAFFGFWAGGC